MRGGALLRLHAGLLGLGLALVAPASQGAFGAPAVVPDWVPFPPAVAPALRYGRLDRVACENELERRGIPFARVDEARGVLAPVRLRGALHGVTFRTGLPETQRASS